MAGHIPTTVEQAVGVLLGLLPQDEIDKISRMPEKDLLFLHFGLGIWIRNNFGLWTEGSPLLAATQQPSADDASMVIIRALWERLQEAAPKIH
ncbi:DUF6794 domain-containing protein [Uliginosibacterium gangwonense]|uniref:DUF6794 domain-containing protein n=1 Tax=Uliginosibacterium gangwonense TaxID=392736 RepID=UPI00036A71B3|nr:DUF6794 domain-containing protein [Uliginosibacterium gangwonense]